MELSPSSSEPVDKKPTLTADGLIQTATLGAATTVVGAAAPEQTTTSPPVVVGGGGGEIGSGSVDQLEIEILPVIYDIIRCVEKDPLDNSAKQRESAECSQKILELQKRFEFARVQIKQLPGIDFNKEEQLQKLELLRNQLQLKQQLIRKYKDTQF